MNEFNALSTKSSSEIPLVEHSERQNRNRAKNLLRKARSKKISASKYLNKLANSVKSCCLKNYFISNEEMERLRKTNDKTWCHLYR